MGTDFEFVKFEFNRGNSKMTFRFRKKYIYTKIAAKGEKTRRLTSKTSENKIIYIRLKFLKWIIVYKRKKKNPQKLKY